MNDSQSSKGRFVKVAKYTGIVLVVVLLLFVVAANFSTVETRLECSGEISTEGGATPATVFVILGEHRWWARLWSKSAGRLFVEDADGYSHWYFGLEKIQHQLTIYELAEQIGGIEGMRGYYSTLSSKLHLILKPDRLDADFTGTCKAAG